MLEGEDEERIKSRSYLSLRNTETTVHYVSDNSM